MICIVYGYVWIPWGLDRAYFRKRYGNVHKKDDIKIKIYLVKQLKI